MTEPEPADAGLRVLVVGGEAGLCRLIVDALAPTRYTPELVASFDKAMASLRGRRPDLVLLYIAGAAAGSWAMLDDLRAEAGAQVPVLVMAEGFGTQERALACGARGYMATPCTAEDLLSAVEAHASLLIEDGREQVMHWAAAGG